MELEGVQVSALVDTPGAQNTNYVSFCVCTDGKDAWSQHRDNHLENPLTQPGVCELITSGDKLNIFG